MMVFAGTPGQVTSRDWSLLLTWEAPPAPPLRPTLSSWRFCRLWAAELAPLPAALP